MSGQNIPPFLNKTYDLVNDPSTDKTISWSPTGDSFIVWHQGDFSENLLPRHFKHSNFSSFVRQLNTYGFKKADPDKWEFSNECFVRGHKELLHGISRRKNAEKAALQPHQGAGRITQYPAIEVGRYGGLADDVESLKRDKNALVAELQRQRRHQQESDMVIHKLERRLDGMDQRHQQTMSFLSTVLQNPAVLTQILQAHAPSHITGRKKKRVSRFDGESGAESPRDEEKPDNTNALVSYRSEPPGDFSKYLANLLAAPRMEEANGYGPNMTQGTAQGTATAPHDFTAVDHHFSNLDLASMASPTLDNGFGGMPSIPTAPGSATSEYVKTESPTHPQNGMASPDFSGRLPSGSGPMDWRTSRTGELGQAPGMGAGVGVPGGAAFSGQLDTPVVSVPDAGGAQNIGMQGNGVWDNSLFNMDDLSGLQLNPSDFSMGDESFWQEYLNSDPINDPGGADSAPPEPTSSETGSRNA